MYFQNHWISHFKNVETPFYFYDVDLLQKTLQELQKANGFGYHVHYALKANIHPRILEEIRKAGLGADCVSGNEVKIALDSGFKPNEVVLAGVGKTDKEIRYAIEKGIFSFNVESFQELEVIDEIAGALGKKASISVRINPEVDAGTHKYITTGSRENKFGISIRELTSHLDLIRSKSNISFIGLHFHIGSQIPDIQRFVQLCHKVNDLQAYLIDSGVHLPHLNLGGGLGIDYHHPNQHPVPDFKAYFSAFNQNLHVREGQEVHFELGRSVVGQCGSLISRVLFTKDNGHIRFVILDAGMSELMRPALYQAYHSLENLTGDSAELFEYDVVGPICETSDAFQRNFSLPLTQRGDLIAIRSTGAYGETMKNNYNARDFAPVIFSDQIRGL